VSRNQRAGGMEPAIGLPATLYTACRLPGEKRQPSPHPSPIGWEREAAACQLVQSARKAGDRIVRCVLPRIRTAGVIPPPSPIRWERGGVRVPFAAVLGARPSPGAAMVFNPSALENHSAIAGRGWLRPRRARSQDGLILLEPRRADGSNGRLGVTLGKPLKRLIMECQNWNTPLKRGVNESAVCRALQPSGQQILLKRGVNERAERSQTNLAFEPFGAA
jgi:hypothetical protein